MKLNTLLPHNNFMWHFFVSGIFFTSTGVSMQNQVAQRESYLHQVQESYFNTPKSERDSASRGSELNAQLVEVQETPPTLLGSKLVGVGKVLTGIFLFLFGILLALMVMSMRIRMALVSLQNREWIHLLVSFLV